MAFFHEATSSENPKTRLLIARRLQRSRYRAQRGGVVSHAVPCGVVDAVRFVSLVGFGLGFQGL